MVNLKLCKIGNIHGFINESCQKIQKINLVTELMLKISKEFKSYV